MCVLLLGALLLAGCSLSRDSDEVTPVSVDGVTLINKGQLTIASDYDSALLVKGESVPSGFEYDLMMALCSQLNLQATWLPSAAQDALLGAVQEYKTADVAISSLAITDANKKTVDFTDAYYDVALGLYTLESNGYTSREDVSGLIVGVMADSYCATWVQANLPQAQMVAFTSSKALFAALRAGHIDGVVADISLGAKYAGTVENNSEYGFDVEFAGTTVVLTETIATDMQYAIAVNTSNDALTKALNEALANIRKDGTYDALYAQYFGTATAAVDDTASTGEEGAEES